MSDFWANYKSPTEGGKFISSDEKQVLIDQGISFEITGLQKDPENQYGPRYIAFVTIPDANGGDPLEAKIGFPLGSGVDSRDSQLANMEQFLEQDGNDSVKAKLTKLGRSIQIVPGA